MTPCGAPVALLTTGLQKPNAKKYALQRWRPSFQSPKPHHQSVQKAVAGSGGVRAHTLVSVVLAMMRGHPYGMNNCVDLMLLPRGTRWYRTDVSDVDPFCVLEGADGWTFAFAGRAQQI